MRYSIKDVAAQIGLSAYTLRYYDKAGLLPFVARDAAGYRSFTDGDLQLLHTIICLKNTGMTIADIRRYVDAVMAGPKSIPVRKALLTQHRARVVARQHQLATNLREVDYKLSLYAAPDAPAKVEQELAAAHADKAANGLPDPFPIR
ncbi:MerR family transcriptional regulator [Lacticaseibacillus thailandensis]|uniref:Transcription regulator n=1 Tax=Lacticaseibacillus thailandensis DSM 22698 = JCM 13996 TaxID=1423810 RepID=A0A0R2C660_9LACO|nr:MerR family transcriptional regulator [Lacticaseibacillus thailandensis]KRM87112.1 transcription regulator [Lacticaseibacillus thailandensis DSM 22698 = JCM 13996]